MDRIVPARRGGSFDATRALRIAVAVLSLTACGDEPGDDDSPEQTRSALEATNLASRGYPWGGAAAGVLKRWELPIPVKSRNEPRAVAAMDEIEQRLGYIVFDRSSIAEVDDAQIQRGFIVSTGTTFVPPGANPTQYCGGAAGFGSPAATSGGVMSYRVYIHLDNSSCRASQEVAVHEFGHAMGMGSHYGGFGDGPAISPLFWRVLQTIYANPPGTPGASIRIWGT